MRHSFSVILKLCNPQASSMIRSSNPNLWQRKRSLTIRQRLAPQIACSTSTLNLDISWFSCFCSFVNSLPFGFFDGIWILTPSGQCPIKPVSCHKLIPQANEVAADRRSFYHGRFHRRFDSKTWSGGRVMKEHYFWYYAFFFAVALFLLLWILWTLNVSFYPIEQNIRAILK